MAGLFQGNPQTATSYVKTTSETPTWMQDAIYNQIQWATNIANRPYEQYELPTVAELNRLQNKAYSQVEANQGSWADAMKKAQGGMYDVANVNTAGGLQTAQSQYARPDLAKAGLEAGQQLYGRAAGMDVIGAARPLLGQAAGINIQGAAQPYLSQAGQTTAQALSDRALSAADPYLQAAAQSSAGQVGQFMNPYQQGVLDVIAKQGARNLSENLLPAVSESFIKAGQFGSSRMGDIGSRALRDTQEAILNQQTQALQQGYGQGLTAAQADLARQAGLAGTVGSISGADLSRILSGGAQYGNLAQTAGGLAGQQAQMYANLAQTTGNLTSEQMRNLAALGSAETGAGQAQQTFGLNAAQAVQQAQSQDAARKLSALQAMANTAQQGQQMGYADTAALEAAGQAQQNQMQKQLDAAYTQYMQKQLYPQQQLDWLSTQVRGMAPIIPPRTTQTGTTTGATYSPSPLQQFATAYYGGKALGLGG